MNGLAHDRLFAACGIAFVALELVGFALGGPTHQLTISSSATHITQTLAKASSTLSWVGAYLDLLGFGPFLAFAVGACARLAGGLLSQVGRAAATSYATLGIASLAVADAIAYRAGKGIDAQLGSALITVNESLFIGTWFLSAFFLLAVGASALASARRVLGWSAIGVALFTLVATAVSVNTLGQFSILLFFGWVACAGVSLARTGRAAASSAVAAARHT